MTARHHLHTHMHACCILRAFKCEVPARHIGGGERLVPQVFHKPGAEATGTMNFIITPMATSSVFRKLDEEQARLEEDAEKIASGGLGRGSADGGKGRGKRGRGRANPKVKATRSRPQGDADAEEEGVQKPPWTNMAYPMLDIFGKAQPQQAPSGMVIAESSRPKTALDDFMNSFLEIVRSDLTKLDSQGASMKTLQQFEDSVMQLFRHTVSCFYEFVFCGSVAMNGKYVRSYSGFRQEMQTFVRTASNMTMTSAVAASSSSSGVAGKGEAALFADLNIDPSSAGVPIGIGHLQGEEDELRAIGRIKVALPTVTSEGMPQFIRDVLPLPLEYHVQFAQVAWSW